MTEKRLLLLFSTETGRKGNLIFLVTVVGQNVKMNYKNKTLRFQFYTGICKYIKIMIQKIHKDFT